MAVRHSIILWSVADRSSESNSMATSELTDMGEDTDDVVTSTSKLRDIIKGMTGVDILESDGKTFKDMYTIISGIAEKWDTLSDIDQASLLETLAGEIFARIYRNINREYI